MSQLNLKKQLNTANTTPPAGYVALYYDSGAGMFKYEDETGTFFSFNSTVTSVSVTTGNGFAGSVTNPTTTPAITISTTQTGFLLGNGTSVSGVASTGSGNVVLSTSPTLTTPILGTPTSVTLTNGTGLPLSGLSGLATGMATFLTTPTSANLAGTVTDETGSGALVFATSPTLVTPALGTPSALVGTNITGTALGLTAGKLQSFWTNAVTVIGLDNTGTTDNTATLNTYLSTAGNQVIYFPHGTYKFGASNTSIAISAGNITFQGDGDNATIFQTSSATADIMAYTVNWYNNVNNISFTSSVTRTAGYAINFGTTNYGNVNSCQFTGMFNGVNIGGNLCYITGCLFSTTINFGISVSGSVNNSYITACTWTAQGSIPAGSAGINVTQCGSLLIDDCDIISMASGLLLNPTSPNGVFSVQATNCFFDTCTNGVNFTGTGNIQRCAFVECWLGDSTNGFSSTNTATTPPSGISFTGCLFMSNTGSGMVCTDMGDFNVSGCDFGGNSTNGIIVSAVATAQTRFTIVGNNIGSMGGLGGGTSGITVNAGTYGSYIISNNTLTGNTTAIVDNGSVSSFNQKLIFDNIGDVIVGNVAAIVAASAALNTTETVIAGGVNTLPIPAGALRAGKVIKATIYGTCTASVANATTFRIRIGTAGTTADTAVLTAALTSAAAGTANPFEVTLYLVVRTAGASATAFGHLKLQNTPVTSNTTASQGISVFSSFLVTGTMAAFNTTVNNYISLTHVTAATTTTNTFQEAIIEIL